MIQNKMYWPSYSEFINHKILMGQMSKKHNDEERHPE